MNCGNDVCRLPDATDLYTAENLAKKKVDKWLANHPLAPEDYDCPGTSARETGV